MSVEPGAMVMNAESTAATTLPANRTPFVALVGASALSEIGSMLTMVALPWFVLVTTGSAAKTGLTGFFAFLPLFVAGLFGGAIVDRLGYQRASVSADLVSGAAIALVPLLYHTIGLAFWQLLALVFLGNLLLIPGLSARRAMLPELAALAQLRLERVNATFEGIQAAALLLGPPLAGLLIAGFGPSNVLWLDAATFAVSAVTVALLVRVAPARQTSGRSYGAELLRGLRFLRRDRVLLSLAVGLALTNFLGEALFVVVLPVYAKEIWGRATVLGLLTAAVGAGSLAGAFGYGAIGHRLSRRVLWLGPFLLDAFLFLAFAALPPLPFVVLGLLLAGLASGPINPLLVTIRHERTPPELRGRVFGTFAAIAQAAAPLGIVLTGYAVEGLGLRATLLGLGAGYLFVSAGMLAVPAFRELDQPAPHLGRGP